MVDDCLPSLQSRLAHLIDRIAAMRSTPLIMRGADIDALLGLHLKLLVAIIDDVARIDELAKRIESLAGVDGQGLYDAVALINELENIEDDENKIRLSALRKS